MKKALHLRIEKSTEVSFFVVANYFFIYKHKQKVKNHDQIRRRNRQQSYHHIRW